MKVRKARPEDLDSLTELKRRMPYPGSLFTDEATFYAEACERLKILLQEERPDWRVLVLTQNEQQTGYLVFMADDEHGVTHQLQSLIVDYAVFSFEALEKLTQRARKIVTAFENLYLVTELPAEDKRLQLWFFRCGFRPEQNRAARRFPLGYQGKSSPAYVIRKARQVDLPFILETHAAYPEAYRPAGRDVDLETIEFRYQLTYAAFDLDNDNDTLYFILEEASTKIQAGYMIVKLTPIGLYIYDVAVAPKYGGRGLSAYLIGHAETLAGKEGSVLYGDGSLGTRTIASWHAQMGYTVDTIRFALDCRLT